MIQPPPLARHLLEHSEDALRTVSGLLDDASPAHGSGPSSFDLHMALGLLDRIYELESAADAPESTRFGRVLKSEFGVVDDSLERRVP